MFLNSIRWRLQLWHGLLLVLVLAGFGFTAYRFQRANQLRRIDQELQQRINVVVSAMRGPENRPGPLREGPRPPGEFGPPPRDRQPPDLPRPGRPQPRPDLPGGFLPRDFRLGKQDLLLFAGSTNDAFYYVVWRRDGQELSRSETAAEVPRPARTRELTSVRMRATMREMFHFTPPGESVLVGRNIAMELAETRRLAWLLLGAGGAVLLLGLAGGWWLSTRAIRPIADISATAAKISTGDLSQRIPAGDADNELGQLAAVLNSTFARLETAFAQQARFTTDAAHELRTPIAVMLAQTQAALARERPGAEYREPLESCQRAAQRMRRLIESLLELARLDAGEEPMKRERVDLSAIAMDCAELVRPLAAERNITIQTNLQTADCVGDGDRLAQVVTNLLMNAIHYNKERGEVRISTQQQNGFAILTVADTGPGIPPDELSHVFERFWRADKARSRSDGRTGLGLAIAKSIVDTHGGSIETASEVTKGTTFTVRLPGS
jgi:heavy metal sensor kinase